MYISGKERYKLRTKDSIDADEGGVQAFWWNFNDGSIDSQASRI